jgi:hypothetical protein
MSAVEMAKTTVCRNCGERFERPRHGGRHKRADAPRIRSAGYCTAACRQAAYRRRQAIAAGVSEAVARERRPRKVRLGPRYGLSDSEVHTSVTAHEISEQNQMVTDPKITTLAARAREVAAVTAERKLEDAQKEIADFRATQRLWNTEALPGGGSRELDWSPREADPLYVRPARAEETEMVVEPAPGRPAGSNLTRSIPRQRRRVQPNV